MESAVAVVVPFGLAGSTAAEGRFLEWGSSATSG